MKVIKETLKFFLLSWLAIIAAIVVTLGPQLIFPSIWGIVVTLSVLLMVISYMFVDVSQ